MQGPIVTERNVRKLKHLPLSVRVPIEEDNPSIVRWEEKCIRCGMCKEACTNLMGVLGTYSLEETGGKAVCIYCGQCANVCPVDSITERDECPQVQQAIADPNKVVVVSTSPAVRAALGEEFGMEPGAFVEGKMVALLRALGVDYVLDTNFAADLTIVEEASELIRRITQKDRPLPQFTSCCPGWVRFVKQHYPRFTAQLSSAKSPHQMMGAVVKNTLAAEADAHGTQTALERSADLAFHEDHQDRHHYVHQQDAEPDDHAFDENRQSERHERSEQFMYPTCYYAEIKHIDLFYLIC